MMRIPSILRLLAVASALAFPAFPGCTREDDAGSSSRTITKAGPAEDRGDRDEPALDHDRERRAFFESDYDIGGTLVVGISSDPKAFSPLMAVGDESGDVMVLLFDGLVRTYPDFSHGPALARTWEFSDDRLELTFHLRDDVTWHDGEPFTAKDVEFTFRLQKHPAVKYHSIQWKHDIEECVALDDHTVRFRFSRRSPYQLMDANVGFPMPRHILEDVPPDEIRNHEFHQAPVGTGPFRLERREAEQHVVLVPNEEYYEPRPPLDRVIFKVVPEAENRLLQIRNGEIDLLLHLSASEHRKLEKEPYLVSHVLPSRRYFYIAWNNKHPLFRSTKVREAMTLAIDRESLRRGIFDDHAELANGPVPPIIRGHNPEVPVFPYDPEAARERLAEEGWIDRDGDGVRERDGERFSFELLLNPDNEVKQVTAISVQQMLREVGVECQPVFLDRASLGQRALKKKFDAFLGGWEVGLKPDLTSIWHSRSIENMGLNVASYANPEVDRLIEQAARDEDRETARDLFWKAQEIIARDQPYTFLYIPKQINVIHERFRNVRMEAFGWNYNLPQWWVPRDRQRKD